jgi:hypothetical protein
MEPIQILTFVPGIILGTLIVSRVGFWLHTVIDSVKRLRMREDSRGLDPSAGNLLAPILLHSGPRLLAATLYWAYYSLANSPTPGWLWFFGGIAIAPILWAPVFWAFRRSGKTSTPGTPPELSDRWFFKFARWLNIERNYTVLSTLTAGPFGCVILTALFFDSVKRAPGLLVVLLAGSMAFAFVISKLLWSIVHPKPWRIPASKQR